MDIQTSIHGNRLGISTTGQLVFDGSPVVTSSAIWNLKTSNTRKWRAAANNVAAGVSNAYVACIGDSTTRGRGGSATAAAQGYNGYPVRLGDKLTTYGINGACNNIFGFGNQASYATTFDDRVTLGSWSGSNTSVGYDFMACTSGTTPMTFLPKRNCDTFQVFYVRASGNGTFTTNINGGATINTINANGASGIITDTTSTSAGANTLGLTRSSGNCFVVGINGLDSTRKEVSFLNWGASGRQASAFNASSAIWSPLPVLTTVAPSLSLICFGINEWVNATAVDTYSTNMQAIITTAKAVGDVILLTPVPSAVANQATRTAQQEYIAAMYYLARYNDIPLIDIWTRFESYEVNSSQFYTDTLHPNAAGYGDIGGFIASALAQIA